ncbi:flagellar hook assembly protein [Terrihabitans soli]|uniref:Basal-body rod modification protein FlgD n=1 Tax=Terrihabitans soli TaxID=708113 RepID=A0A6S6QSF8_9HYPH|nr:flagellar hook capping FlgD N-terminal domain-containing protein [Terrihabitans soli]BCJ89991.1 flagellar hook assembly protein [Terrihabitans soli]
MAGLNGVTSAPPITAQSYSGGAQIADNFQSFLQLLTTQLQNQNPLDPLDTNQFTQQLVQFAGVEQQISTNSTLAALLQVMDTSRLTGAVDYIGKQITAEGATTVLDEQSAVWNINVGSEAPQTTIVVSDAAGNQVYTQDINLTKGNNVYAWQGKSSSGQVMPDGFYTIQVVARDAKGQPVTATTDIQGKVTGVELENGEPVLKIGDTIRVKLANIKSVVTPPAAPPADDSSDT